MEGSASTENMMESQEKEHTKKPKRVLSPHGQDERFLYPAYSSWNAAANFIVVGLLTATWPAQVSAIIQDPSKDDLYNGIIPAPGALVSVIVSPLAGVASDYVLTKFGRRRIFMLIGSIIMVVTGIAMAPFNKNTGFNSVFALMGINIAHQVGSQLAYVPYLALLPDITRPEKIGLASGWQGAAAAFGTIAASLPAGFLVDAANDTNYWPTYIFIVVGFIVLALPTFLYVKEGPLPRLSGHPCKNLKATYFNLPPKKYRDFYFTIATRAFFNMGVYSIIPYLQYFFRDILKSSAPATMSAIALGILIVTSIPSTLLSGHLSDKYGRKAMVLLGCGVMALGLSAFAIISFFPYMIATYFIAVFLGIGYGIYQAVDGALALDVLPRGTSIARDLGFWQMALVVPSAIAPAIAGAILNVTRRNHSDAVGYCVMLFVVALWFGFSFLSIIPVKVDYFPHRNKDKNSVPDEPEEKKDNTELQDLNSSSAITDSGSFSLSNSSASSVSNVNLITSSNNEPVNDFDQSYNADP